VFSIRSIPKEKAACVTTSLQYPDGKCLFFGLEGTSVCCSMQLRVSRASVFPPPISLLIFVSEMKQSSARVHYRTARVCNHEAGEVAACLLASDVAFPVQRKPEK